MAGFGKHAGAVDGDPAVAVLRRQLEGRPEFGKRGVAPVENLAPVSVLRPGQSFSERMAEIWDGDDAA